MGKICIDFDGTVVTHEYPYIGKDIGSIPVLNDLIMEGHKLILDTMRSGNELNDAIQWFEDNAIELYGIYADPNQKNWTTSPKAYGELSIDDRNLGCPKIFNPQLSKRPFIDWKRTRELLIEEGYLQKDGKKENNNKENSKAE
jgi:hypothetical protein